VQVKRRRRRVEGQFSGKGGRALARRRGIFSMLTGGGWKIEGSDVQEEDGRWRGRMY
jgi:hypothetical protein